MDKRLFGIVDENQTIHDFNAINTASNLNWAFKSQIKKFSRRFFIDPYREEDLKWIKELASENNVNIKRKLLALNNLL